jgi:hypothetical protein
MEFDRVMAQYSDFSIRNPAISNDLRQLSSSISEVRHFTPDSINAVTNALTMLKMEYENAEKIINDCKIKMKNEKAELKASVFLVILSIIFLLSATFDAELIGTISFAAFFWSIFYLGLIEFRYPKRILSANILFPIIFGVVGHNLYFLPWGFGLLVILYFSYSSFNDCANDVASAESNKKSILGKNKSISENIITDNNNIVMESFDFLDGLNKFKKNRNLIPIGIQTDKILSVLNDMNFGNMILQITEMIDSVNYAVTQYGSSCQKKTKAINNDIFLDGSTNLISNKNTKALLGK